MPIPNRTEAGHYHYHAYSYKDDTEAGPWVPSAPDALRLHMKFFSLREDLKQLAADGVANKVPNLALEDVGVQIDGDGSMYRTMALSFGSNDRWAPKVVLTGGIHSREWIASEVTYLIAEYLIKHYHTDPVGDYQKQLSDLINTRKIYIVPMLNPAGNAYSMTNPNGDIDWRKNRRPLPGDVATWANDLKHPPFENIAPNAVDKTVNYDVPKYVPKCRTPKNYRTVTIFTAVPMLGVDCNRNFNTSTWGMETYNNKGFCKNEGDPTSSLYFGPGRASEAETANLEALVVGLGKVAASVDYHCYGRFIILPTEVPVSRQHKYLGEALQMLIRRKDSPDIPPYKLGTAMDMYGYTAEGSVMGHLAEQRNSRAFTIELEPGLGTENASWQLPEDKIMSVFEENIRGALSLIATAGNNPRSFWGGFCGCGCSSPWASSVSKFLDWAVEGRGNQLPL